MPYIALQDSHDEDVLEAGTLVGLSCAGQYEIQTCFYTTTNGGADMVADAIIGPDGVTGNIKVVAVGSGIPIMGRLTRNHGPLFLGETGEGNNGQNSSAIQANLYVVSFNTGYAINDTNA